MSRLKDLIIDIQEQIESGELTHKQIAEKFNVTVDFVNQVDRGLIRPNENSDHWIEE